MLELILRYLTNTETTTDAAGLYARAPVHHDGDAQRPVPAQHEAVPEHERLPPGDVESHVVSLQHLVRPGVLHV